MRRFGRGSNSQLDRNHRDNFYSPHKRSRLLSPIYDEKPYFEQEGENSANMSPKNFTKRFKMQRFGRGSNSQLDRNHGDNFHSPNKRSRLLSMSYDEKSDFEQEGKNNAKASSEILDSKPFQKSVEVYADESESYFKSVLETLKQGIPDDQKDIFIQNVLDQTKGKELQLSCQSVGSRLIEVLLEQSRDISTILQFMRALSENREDSCGNRFASYVTEKLLYYGLLQLQNWNQDIEPEVQNEDAKAKAAQLIEIINWIHDLAEFCYSNLQTCLEDRHGCHVLRTLIQVLGGHYMGESGINQSKRGQKQKQQFEEEYLGAGTMFERKQVISLPHVPKFFVEVLKRISHRFLELENLKEFLVPCTMVFQSHLLVLKKRLPKHSIKFNKAIINLLFESRNHEGIPEALADKNCSYLVERLFESCCGTLQEKLWGDHFYSYLEQIVVHPVGNFVLQKLFNVVENKDLFDSMSSAVLELFPMIYQAHHLGIVVSVASACVRLGRQQAQFMKRLMECLQCNESEDRQKLFLPLLLGFQTYDAYIQDCANSGLFPITLQGSLVAQSVLRFDKPIKCIRSLLEMKPEVIKYLACHMQGCHVFTAFFGSSSVGAKNKDKLLDHIKPIITPLAKDRNGSLTLARTWVLLSLKQKIALALEIANNEKIISESQSGFILIKKFRIYQFKNRRQEWEQFQTNLEKKRICK